MRTLLFVVLLGCGGHHATTVDGSAGDGESVSDAAAADGALPDGPKPDVYPRLVVASASGVLIWDHATEITSNRMPDAKLGSALGVLGLAVAGDTLFATTSGATGVYRYDGVSTIGDGAAPSGAITGFPMAFSPAHTPVSVDPAGNLWLDANGEIDLVANAAAATAPTARFTHAYQQVVGMVYEPTSGRLFGGQISGAGLLAWNAAAARTGTVTGGDFMVSPMVFWHGTLASGRMFGTHYSPPDVAIWDSPSAITGAKAPDHLLHNVCGGANNAGLRYSGVSGDTLVLVHDEVVSSMHTEKVCLFTGASTLAAEREPDAVVTSAALHPSLTADKAILTSDGYLFVLDDEGVAIFRDAMTSPVLVAKLLVTSPMDMLVLE
jgi:hypothetical protein